jgi:hypothetical protein
METARETPDLPAGTVTGERVEQEQRPVPIEKTRIRQKRRRNPLNNGRCPGQTGTRQEEADSDRMIVPENRMFPLPTPPFL